MSSKIIKIMIKKFKIFNFVFGTDTPKFKRYFLVPLPNANCTLVPNDFEKLVPITQNFGGGVGLVLASVPFDFNGTCTSLAVTPQG